MASFTKAQLAAQLEQAHVAYEALSIKYESTRLDLDSANERLALARTVYTEMREQLAARPTPSFRPGQRAAYVSTRQPSTEQLAIRERMAAAKAAALASGQSVRVG